MNRDYPLAPTSFGDNEKKIKRLEKREDKLVKKGNKAVDEGRDKKADRLLGRAAKVEDRKIRLSERK
jgi:phage shock protein A